MHSSRLKLIIIVLIISLTSSLGACGFRPQPTKTESGQKIFRLGFTDTPDSLNPYTAETEEAAAVFSLLYDTLFYADIETGRYINSVCKEYTVQEAASDGATLWTITLRDDVFFHDGILLTASDVEFSLQSMKDFSRLYAYPYCELIDTTGIAVTDDTHLSFLAWGDVSAVEECLSHVPLVPRSVWNSLAGMEYSSSGIPSDAATALESLSGTDITAELMIGSGLYIWESYDNGTLTLRRNEDYWNGTSQAEIVELHFGCDNLAESMQNDEIDAAWNLSYSSAEELAEGRSTTSGTAGELFLIEFNQHTDASSNGSALLLDKTIREAIALCADRETIAQTGFGGAMTATEFCMPYGYETAATAAFDTEMAVMLLANAGYTDTDGDGVRESSDGERLSFRILCSNSDPAWVRAANILHDSCAEAGIEMEVIALSPDKALASAEDEDFDLYLTAVQTYYDAYLSLAYYCWNEGNGAYWNGTSSPGWNISGYSNDEFDELYNELVFASSTVRDDLQQRMESILIDDCAALPLAYAAKNQSCSGAWLGLRADHGAGLFFTPSILRQQLQGITG